MSTETTNPSAVLVTPAPKTEAPKTEAPKTETPKVEAPAPEAPKTEAPKTEAPKTEAPKTEAPAPVEESTDLFSDEEYDTLEKDYLENGDFTDKSLEILGKKKIRPELARDWAAGRQAQAELVRAQCALAVGGEDKLAEWQKWASTELSKEDIEALNADILEATQAGPKAIAAVVKRAFDNYTDNVGQRGRLVGGGGASGVRPFRTEKEYMDAFSDPRYHTSEAYRLEVEERLRASNQF